MPKYQTIPGRDLQPGLWPGLPVETLPAHANRGSGRTHRSILDGPRKTEADLFRDQPTLHVIDITSLLLGRL
ncbi:MAG: hypothetical protein KJ749_00155 [Planctomycetes bacterium]|nr:hypothetical protein [Planctomycetota bacterium]